MTMDNIASFLTIAIGAEPTPLRSALMALAATYRAHAAARAADGITGLELGPISTSTHDAIHAALRCAAERLTANGYTGARGGNILQNVKRLALENV